MKKTILLSIIFLVILCLCTYLNSYIKNEGIYSLNFVYINYLLLLVRIFSAIMLGYVLTQKRLTMKPTIIMLLITIGFGLLYHFSLYFPTNWMIFIWHPTFEQNKELILLVITFLVTKIISCRKKSY